MSYKLKAEDVLLDVINILNLSARDSETLYKDFNDGNGQKWLEEIENKGDGNLVARYKVICNIIDEPDETDGEYDNYPTEQKFFVYDKDDNCVSDGFHFEDGAIAFANRYGYPVVKIHRYYRDPTRGYKLYPLDSPETVWAYGRPVKHSFFGAYDTPVLPTNITIKASQLQLDSDDIVNDKTEMENVISCYLNNEYSVSNKGFHFGVIYNDMREPSEFIITDIVWDAN